jgi:AraC family transcriptional regulator
MRHPNRAGLRTWSGARGRRVRLAADSRPVNRAGSPSRGGRRALSKDDQANLAVEHETGEVMDADRLRAILDLIEESLGEPEVAGADLAGRAYVSRFHFDRVVRAALGEPPGAFRRRLLLERAAHRLMATDDAVIDVAFDAGYSAPEAFARAFARAFGASPSNFRRRRDAGHELPAQSGIHFHPPGGLRLPATERSTTVDVVIRMLDHHLLLVGEMIDRLERGDDDALDRSIELSTEGIDRDPTLRRVCDRLVGQLEMWVGALEGSDRVPVDRDSSRAGLRRRFGAAGPRFRELLVPALQQGRADETFLDATCEPPQTFSYGGVLAHVLTFSAVRRTLAIGALESNGVNDLGAGDPMAFVGGTGDDASTIQRRWT